MTQPLHPAGHAGAVAGSSLRRAQFLPGLQLCGSFYSEAVRPIIEAELPGLKYAAALIGDGSEVLGLDDAQSTDHDWGPRLMLFLHEADYRRCAPLIDAALRRDLPGQFRGYPTTIRDAIDDPGVRVLAEGTTGPVSHGVAVFTPTAYCCEYLGVDPDGQLAVTDWLTLSEQKLLGFTSGAVYHDEVGLETLRGRFSYYPHDVWLYLLAAGWTRIGQEEHLVGRAGSVGDELGSTIIASRLVRDIMRLGFLMEKHYAPYPKWLGTAFARLHCSHDLLPELRGVMLAETWRRREVCLVRSYERLAEMHNRLGVTPALPASAMRFHERPYLVIGARRFSEALLGAVRDPEVLALVARPPIGSLDQISDNVDLASAVEYREALKALY